MGSGRFERPYDGLKVRCNNLYTTNPLKEPQNNPKRKGDRDAKSDSY